MKLTGKSRMNRRRFLKYAGATAVSVLSASAFGAALGKERRPNILFVSIDDLNDWIEPLGGHPQAKTPNLKRFAAQSVNFTRAYCPNPACCPSRTAVMTGLAPYTSGVYSNYQDWREVITDYTSLGKYFRDNGYYSAGAGKIYHYHMVDPTCWDEYWPSQKKNMPDEYLPQKHAPGWDPETSIYKTINMPEFPRMYKMFDWASLDIEDPLMGDYRSVQWVSDKLAEDHEKPFFLACGIFRPHVPWYVPKEYFDMFQLEEVQLPKVLANDLDDLGERPKAIASRGGNYHKSIIKADLWKDAVRGYLASIAFADAMLGKLLDALEKSKYARNTIVVVWSDHGWQLGEKTHWRKFALWENVVRCVLMIKAPKSTPGLPEGSKNGAICGRTVSLQDIYPTLLELAGLKKRTNIDGHSLVPLLKKPKASWKHPAITTYDFGEFTVRTEKYRYTLYIDESEELYDHTKDPEEWTNLANDPKHAETIRRLKKHIPDNPAPLVQTSRKLEPHHFPPFKSQREYKDYVAHGNEYRVRKYWQ